VGVRAKSILVAVLVKLLDKSFTPHTRQMARLDATYYVKTTWVNFGQNDPSLKVVQTRR
jgi:hypothetical protein